MGGSGIGSYVFFATVRVTGLHEIIKTVCNSLTWNKCWVRFT